MWTILPAGELLVGEITGELTGSHSEPIFMFTYAVFHVLCDHESRVTQALISPAVILANAIQAHVRIGTFVFV